MAKNIAEKSVESADAPKQVTIKHLKTMKNASGNDVTVVDWQDTKTVDEAISQAEASLASAEAQVIELKADIVAYKAIKG
jgi:hypothetical protein